MVVVAVVLCGDACGDGDEPKFYPADLCSDQRPALGVSLRRSGP